MTAVASSAVPRTSFTMAMLGVAAATALLLGAVGLGIVSGVKIFDSVKIPG